MSRACGGSCRSSRRKSSQWTRSRSIHGASAIESFSANGCTPLGQPAAMKSRSPKSQSPPGIIAHTPGFSIDSSGSAVTWSPTRRNLGSFRVGLGSFRVGVRSSLEDPISTLFDPNLTLNDSIQSQCRLTTGVLVSSTTRSGLKAASFESNASGESSEAMPSRKRTSCPAFFSIVAAVAGTTGKM